MTLHRSASDLSPTAAMSLRSDESIMLMICQIDDAAAFGELVERWREQIQLLCFRLTGNWQDAEDAVQETFTRVYSRRSQFRGDSRFSTWLWRIAIRAASDTRRKRKPESSLEDGQHVLLSTAEPAQASQATELRDAVVEALNQLTEEQRVVVTLRHFHQMKFREISDVLGIPQGTVCSRMAEALNQLGLVLRPFHSDESRSTI